jgi:hypothetical protein
MMMFQVLAMHFKIRDIFQISSCDELSRHVSDILNTLGRHLLENRYICVRLGKGRHVSASFPEMCVHAQKDLISRIGFADIEYWFEMRRSPIVSVSDEG